MAIVEGWDDVRPVRIAPVLLRRIESELPNCRIAEENNFEFVREKKGQHLRPGVLGNFVFNVPADERICFTVFS